MNYVWNWRDVKMIIGILSADFWRQHNANAEVKNVKILIGISIWWRLNSLLYKSEWVLKSRQKCVI